MPSITKGNLSLVSKKTTNVSTKKTVSKKATPIKSTVKKTVSKKAAPAKSTTTAKKTTAAKKTTTPVTKKSTATASKKLTKAEQLYESYKGQEHKFELYCENYLSRHSDKYGNPKIQPKVKDKGVDIISIKKDDWGTVEKVYYVSVKNKPTVGTPIVDSLVGAMGKFVDKYGDDDTVHIALVMTSGKITADAKGSAKKYKYKVQYLDGNALSKEARFD